MKFIFNKAAGLQAYNQELYCQMNSFTGIFQGFYLDLKNTILSTPCIDSSPPSKECNSSQLRYSVKITLTISLRNIFEILSIIRWHERGLALYNKYAFVTFIE